MLLGCVEHSPYLITSGWISLIFETAHSLELRLQVTEDFQIDES